MDRTAQAELELLLCCAHARLDQAGALRIRAILRDQVNWPGIMAAAFEHHLEPLLYENMRQLGDGLVPDACLSDMRESARKTAGMAFLFSAELLRVCELFESHGVPLVPYKGPVLAWLAYGCLTRRRFLDLDFFVPQTYVSQAADLLESAGYESEQEDSRKEAGHSGSVPGQYSFCCQTNRVQVELHTERTLRHFPVPLDFDKMRSRLIAVELCGRNVRTFSIEDTLVMLCVHGAKHFWERISWLVDVAELIAAQPVDWPLTLRIAAKVRSTRLLLLGLYLSHDLLNAPVPESVLARAQADSNIHWLATKVREELAERTGPPTGVVPRAVFRFRSRDGIADAVSHTLRLATSRLREIASA